MQDPSIQNKLADTKAAREVQALDEFYAMMNADPDRAFYGYSHVAKANEHGAIGTLLVTDELFRSADIATRRKYVDLVESVRSMGGTVRVFSSMHVSGERKLYMRCMSILELTTFAFFVELNLLSGVAAILTFPFPGIDDGEEEDEEGEGDNNEQ